MLNFINSFGIFSFIFVVYSSYMTHIHRLESELHSEFLNQGRIDPITGEKIEEGHTIVICSACKSAFFIESWEYLGETHCNQSETLSEIPKPKNLFLEAKPLEYLPFLFKKGNHKMDNTLYRYIESVLTGVATVAVVILIPALLYVNPLISLVLVIMIMTYSSVFMNKPAKPMLERRINSRNAIQIRLDAKQQTITVKKKNKTTTIRFDEIKVLRYFIENVHTDVINYEKHALSIQIITSKSDGDIYYALLDVDEISKWSNFLEELPYNMKVLQIMS